MHPDEIGASWDRYDKFGRILQRHLVSGILLSIVILHHSVWEVSQMWTRSDWAPAPWLTFSRMHNNINQYRHTRWCWWWNLLSDIYVTWDACWLVCHFQGVRQAIRFDLSLFMYPEQLALESKYGKFDGKKRLFEFGKFHDQISNQISLVWNISHTFPRGEAYQRTGWNALAK